MTDVDRAQARFEPGDAVRFAARSGPGKTGTIEKLNPKRARVRCEDGTWSVPYRLLERVDGSRAEGNGREERLHEVARQARALMDEHGLEAWAFRFSAAESRLGECREREKVIRLSRRHAVNGDPREVRDTILHEIAHALAGAAARHGPAWKAVAKRLGATPKARAEESEESRAGRQAAKARFRAGMAVRFQARGGRVCTGAIVRMNPKRARVDCGGAVYLVPYPALEPAGPPDPAEMAGAAREPDAGRSRRRGGRGRPQDDGHHHPPGGAEGEEAFDWRAAFQRVNEAFAAVEAALGEADLPSGEERPHRDRRPESASIGSRAGRSEPAAASASGAKARPGAGRAVPIPRKLRDQLALCASSPDRILFLDVETTGLSHFYDEITLVGWTFAGAAKTLVKGQDPGPLIEDAARAKALITFNGIRFDTKFLAKELPAAALPEAHVDLMYLCRRLGLKGGQKAIEKELNIRVRDGLADVDGAAAVLLWHRYLRGDAAALRKLIHYNRADIAAMGAILDLVVPCFALHPDLFLDDPRFRDWSAPEGWRDLSPVLSAVARPTGGGGPPPPRFEGLFGGTPAAGSRVVGIDLTGSEARGSGWCLLDGSKAEIAVLHTDEDILERTVRARPALVSIDSPLCLPRGRISVDDSDPGRREFGIMRESERVLKRRGVNVYPCLIRSMQKLTARGIRLAETLRGQGVPVIESYPGAAQDIMRIPRKGAGPEWLKRGLTDFGVSGAYETGDVTHDELDAITAALVGTFHLAGMTEALGTDEEPPLIIPRLGPGRPPVVIGVSGPIAAGKTTLARTLERRGFAYTRFSLVLDDLLAERGQPRDRLRRQELGNEINASGRQRWLSARTVARVADADRIVIDGLRFPDDHAFLVERFGASFRHVFIDAGADLRRSRYGGGEGGAGGDTAFDNASGAVVERRVDELRSLAHEVFANQGDLPAIERRAAQLAARTRTRQ